MDNIKDIIDFLNSISKSEHGNLDRIYDSMSEKDYSKIEDLNIRVVKRINTDSHRWFIIGDNVYQVYNKQTDDIIGYIGVTEVIETKSEEMSISDCYVKPLFYEVEEVQEITYKRKGV